MKPTVLVATSVHWPDDTRIRERLVRTLSADFRVVYATRLPGPTDPSGLEWLSLPGGRARRAAAVVRHAVAGTWDVLVVHDPELLPAAILAKLLRRSPVVFDVHENIPATAMTRDWVPDLFRRPLASFVGWVLRAAESVVTVTLAEPGYASLFRSPDHPVFPNYPDTSDYPPPGPGDGSVVYLGDVTLERGAAEAVAACKSASVPLSFIGRVTESLRRSLGRGSFGESVSFIGPISNPEAIRLVRARGVGISPLHDTPNYRHSTPTKILEYLAVGVPVVASDLPGTRDLVAGLDAVTLVKPGDVDGLASGIGRALEPHVRAAAAAQAPLVRDRFRWPAEDVSRFYRSLV